MTIQKVSGKFEVIEGGVPVVTGRIYTEPPESKESQLWNETPPPSKEADSIDMGSRDIYKELRLRGYDYTGAFRSLESADSTGWHLLQSDEAFHQPKNQTKPSADCSRCSSHG